MVIDTHFDKPFNSLYAKMIAQWLASGRELREEGYFHIARIAYCDVYGVAAGKALHEIGIFPAKLVRQIEKKYNEMPLIQEGQGAQ